MPVPCVRARKGGHYPLQRQPGPDGRRVVDVHIVIEIDEVITDCLTEHGQTKPGKKQAYTDGYTAVPSGAW